MDLVQASILISSSEPNKLAQFYSFLLKSSLCKGITEKDLVLKPSNALSISFFKPSKKRIFARQSQPSVSLCFEKPPSKEPLLTLVNWIDELSGYGGKIVDGPRLEPFGAEAWFSDLDGNKFLILVPSLQPFKGESLLKEPSI